MTVRSPFPRAAPPLLLYIYICGMNTVGVHRFVIFLLASIVLLSAFSCFNGERQFYSVLEVADSLIMNRPQEALDTLQSMQCTSLEEMSRSCKAFYDLLITEAEYKCYYPFDKDTAIFEAVKFFRRHGPECKLARALVMQGALLYERGDAEGAMAAYKEAEPILERKGDLEQIGLINIRIGELYSSTLVDIPESITRLKRAAICFEQAHKEHRIASVMFSLANLCIASDSSEAAYRYLVRGIEYAELSKDTLAIVEGSTSLAGYYLYAEHPDYVKCREVAMKAVGMVNHSGNNYYETEFLDKLFNFLAESYIKTKQIDSASYYMGRISSEDKRSEIMKLYLNSKIAILKYDTVSSLRSKIAADSLYYDEIIYGYKINMHNLDVTAESKLLRMQLDNSHRIQTIYRLVTIIITLSVIILFIIVYSLKKKIRRDVEHSMELVSLFEKNSKEKDKELNDIRRLSNELQKRLDNEFSAKSEWIILHENLMKMENEILDTYYRYGTANSFSSKIKNIIDSYFPEKKTDNRILDIVNHLYPGFIDYIKTNYSMLTEYNLYLIALIVCGFSTGALCALLRCSENSLNVAKARIAKKMGIRVRLTSFITSTLEAYSV